ncbi:MAG: glucosaminidase domain-containing protein [Muribaculaceae bacterium]|nr:glucosaminidase domain-containing protein [Muribaculaceae bacterium]MBR5118322.1 glucosaminidase domain-containing protein [Muribaculaceae bacterium]
MTRDEVYRYIDTYKNAALIEQREHGIPASITLAQGLLESAAGTSKLAREGNNHFGIKCHRSWRGDSVFSGKTCYRKYRSAHDSYTDHSKFLKAKRYESLFTLEITDYRAWAHGLKRCGYATDPLYAEKLINMIETYGLDKYVGETPKHEEEKPGRPKRDRPLLRHPTKRRHDLNYIMAVLGDTYQDIADEYNMKLDKLLDYNDLSKGSKQPEVGDIIYVNRKHSEAHGAHEQYRVSDDGITLWQISQMFGIRLKDLAKINNLTPEAILHKGDLIKLKRGVE